MPATSLNPHQFSRDLFSKLQQLNPGVGELEPYEFQYALKNLTPAEGWTTIHPEPMETLQAKIASPEFFSNIQLKPKQGDQIILDHSIASLSRQLFVGLVGELYPLEWVDQHFYFDMRSFVFFVRTNYVNKTIKERFGGSPYRFFEPGQPRLEKMFEVGYKDFARANQEIDLALIQVAKSLISTSNKPLLLTIVGPTASGKSEISSRLLNSLSGAGFSCTSVEMDNFYKDRVFRDGRPMDAAVIHFSLFMDSINALLRGEAAEIPRYDFIQATSSHDLDGHLRPGQYTQTIQPADIIILEGNFPFHIHEISSLIDLKIVYFANDPIRLKRKWKRDVDFRKKYDTNYLANRYFRTQFQRNQEIYQPMMQCCDIIVDTSNAQLFLHPDLQAQMAD